jgi:hypothetical protein
MFALRTHTRRAVALGAFALAACGGADATAPDAGAAGPRQLDVARFSALEAGAGRGSEDAARQRRVITTAGDWQAFWRGLVPDPNAHGPAPAVDFAREMVIVAVMPLRPSGGYVLDIERVTEYADHIEASVVERSPGADCFTTGALTRPFDVVRVPRRDKPVRFVERAVTTQCGAAASAPTPAAAASDTVRAPFAKPVDAGAGTRVTLRRVVQDSRCPINALCVTAGSASVELRFERAGAAPLDTVLHTNPAAGPSAVTYGPAEFRLFGLTPSPVAGAEPPQSTEYVALLVRRDQ